MSDSAIRVEKMGKRYMIGERSSYPLLRDLIAGMFTSPFRKQTRSERDILWALRDVSFEVKEGEVLGLVGRNGAGKSTLLKILARITRPTTGWAQIHGRIGSLLEVGTGFHGELTGRENVFLTGSILGMKKSEISRKFDEIVAFSEVERFLDTPLKHFSSGMQMRLAFAVAAHLEPEILLIDEVLTVGDISFQRKCLGKMGEVAGHGRTIIFVSHQMLQVRRICKRVIWLDGGTIRESGPTADVVGAYEENDRIGDAAGSSRAGSGRARFLSWELDGAREGQPHVLDSHGEVLLKFKARVNEPLRGIHHGIALYNQAREVVWGNCVDDLILEPGVHEITCKLPYLPLKPGTYYWRAALYHSHEALDDWECTPSLTVSTEPVGHRAEKFAGFLNIASEFTVRPAEDKVHT